MATVKSDFRAVAAKSLVLGGCLIILLLSDVRRQSEAAKEPFSCHLREVELCALGFSSILQNPNGIPVNELEFKRQCEYFKESEECVDQYSERCLSDSQNSMLRLFGSDAMGIAHEFCEPKSELRANYTKFAPCLRKVQKEHQSKCVTDFRVGFEAINKANTSQRLIVGCCNYNRLKECFYPPIEAKCGEEALNFVRLLLTRAVGTPIEMLCRDYDPLAFYCASALPPVGTKPQTGNNVSALSRMVSSFTSAQVR